MGFGSFLKKATLAPLRLGVKATRAAVTAPMKATAAITKKMPGGNSMGSAMGKVASTVGATMGQKKKKPSPGIGPSMM